VIIASSCGGQRERLLVTRIPPGPFNGFFDDIHVEHPAFVPWAVLTVSLLLYFAANVAMLYRRPRRREPAASDPRRGFEIVTNHSERRD